MSGTSVTSQAQAFVDNFNESYAQKHEEFESQFWGTKMALKDGNYTTHRTRLAT